MMGLICRSSQAANGNMLAAAPRLLFNTAWLADFCGNWFKTADQLHVA